jgi:hypothetical protein
LDSNKIYFDVFPNKAMGYGGMYEEYLELSAKSEYFTIKESVSPDMIAKTLGMYHFGSMLYIFDTVDVKDSHLSSVVPTKFITYIEAGIPILVSKKLDAVADIVEKYGIGLVIYEDLLTDNGALCKAIYGCDYSSMLCNIERFQGICIAEVDKIFCEIFNIGGE